MYVCLCKGVTDGQIREAVANGAGNLTQVSHCLGVAKQCGKCACQAKSVIRDAQREHAGFSAAPVYSAG